MDGTMQTKSSMMDELREFPAAPVGNGRKIGTISLWDSSLMISADLIPEPTVIEMAHHTACEQLRAKWTNP